MLSKLRFNCEAACCHFSPDGSLIAVGLKSGEIVIVHAADLSIWGRRRDRKSCVCEIRFSPNGERLACGTEEAVVDIYDVTSSTKFNRLVYCKSVEHPVLHLDFSADSHFLKISTAGYEIKIYRATDGIEETNASVIDEIVWASWTE